MDDWKKFSETSLPKKKDLCSHLNVEDAGYTQAKTVCRDFEITKLGEYHDLHVERDRFLLPDVFKNFQNTCLASFYQTRISMRSSLKKDQVNIDLLPGIYVLLMVEKGIRGGTYHAINRYVKDSNKCVKDYCKNKESSYLKQWDVNKLYGWTMSQKLLVNGFKLVETESQFMNIS